MTDQIITHPDTRLRLKSKPVELLTPGKIQRIANLFPLLYQSGGIGLSAIQVGWPTTLFIVDIGTGKKVYINPEITWSSEETVTYPEGCLSVPGRQIWISRPKRIRLKSRNLDWELVEVEADGILARVIQHEFEHLLGILFTAHEQEPDK